MILATQAQRAFDLNAGPAQVRDRVCFPFEFWRPSSIARFLPCSKTWRGIYPERGPGILRIGGSYPGMAFQGGIAHVAIWNRLLSDEKIAMLWAEGQEDLKATESARRFGKK